MLDRETEAAPVAIIAAGDGQFSYRTAGTGAALVLLHGIGSNSFSWAAQLRALSRHRRIIAWDAPGYGASTPLTVDQPVAEDYAEALSRFLDAQNIEKCDLVGHSLGSLIAARFAGSRAGRVRRLVLASCACGYGTNASGPFPDTIRSRFEDIDELGPAGLADKRSANLLSDSGRDRHLDDVHRAMREVTSGGYRQATYLLAQGNIYTDAPDISCPTLVICGVEDRITPEAIVQPVSEVIPDAHYVAIPAAGHAVYVEQAEPFNQAIGEFLGSP